MSKLYKSNGESLNDFFSMPEKSFKEHVPEMKKDLPQKEERNRDWAVQKPATKMSNSSAIDSRGSKFLNAGMGSVSNENGPRKHIGSNNQNSMWDSEVISRLAKTKGNDEKTTEAKEQIDKVRNGFKQERMDDLVAGIQEADIRKDSGITNLSTTDGSSNRKSYRMPSNNISIFDDNTNFERIPEKSKGDKIREAARAPKEKDTSWRTVNGTKNLSNKRLVDTLFDNLMKE